MYDDGHEPRLLIVNADDFGLTPGISEGILRAHERGIVTSTSVLAVAQHFEAAAPALESSTLGVGVHFALIGEDPPLLGAREIPTLVRRGRFRRSWREFLVAASLGRVDRGDVERELRAQLERVLAAGLRPTHVDTHQHLHLVPSVADVVLRLATSAGIHALRVPMPIGRSPRTAAVRRVAGGLVRRAAALGMRSTEAFAGLEESGHLVEDRLVELLGSLSEHPARSIELGVHPGLATDPDRARFRWGFEWPEELAALCSPRVRDAVERGGFRLGSYDELR